MWYNTNSHHRSSKRPRVIDSDPSDNDQNQSEKEDIISDAESEPNYKKRHGREMWEPSSSESEDFGEAEGGDENGQWDVEIIGEEVAMWGSGKKPDIRYEAAWKNWKRADGTNTTWNNSLLHENDIKAWNQKESQRREKLASESTDIDISILTNIDVHLIPTQYRQHAVEEKVKRHRAEERQKKKEAGGKYVSMAELTRRNMSMATEVPGDIINNDDADGNDADADETDVEEGPSQRVQTRSQRSMSSATIVSNHLRSSSTPSSQFDVPKPTSSSRSYIENAHASSSKSKPAPLPTPLKPLQRTATASSSEYIPSSQPVEPVAPKRLPKKPLKVLPNRDSPLQRTATASTSEYIPSSQPVVQRHRTTTASASEYSPSSQATTSSSSQATISSFKFVSYDIKGKRKASPSPSGDEMDSLNNIHVRNTRRTSDTINTPRTSPRTSPRNSFNSVFRIAPTSTSTPNITTSASKSKKRVMSPTRTLDKSPSTPTNTHPSKRPRIGPLSKTRTPSKSNLPRHIGLAEEWSSMAKRTGAAPITLTNDVDKEEIPPLPPGFMYLESEYWYSNKVQATLPSYDEIQDVFIRCECRPNYKCTAYCACQGPAELYNGRGEKRLAYTKERLFNAFDIPRGFEVIECNKVRLDLRLIHFFSLSHKSMAYQQCPCDPVKCPNRVAQQPRDVPIDIFKTTDRGWGVRARVNVKRGKVLGIYTGRRDATLSLPEEEKSYLFDIDGREAQDDEDPELEHLYSVDSKAHGNWTRFVNHSCNPNLIVYLVVFDTIPEVSPITHTLSLRKSS
ncbi:hypothetical protein H0H93_000206 [Arthromyces matolae]|nr:hypothetical protein H0H93_000206 [Arthromyces matolae]